MIFLIFECQDKILIHSVVIWLLIEVGCSDMCDSEYCCVTRPTESVMSKV